MFSKYLALLLVAIQVTYAAPTLSSRQSQPAAAAAAAAGCSPSYPSGFGISVVPISGEHASLSMGRG